MPLPETGRRILEQRFRAIFGPFFPTDAWTAPRWTRLTGEIHYRMIDAGSVIVRAGGVCPGVSFVVQGSIRVFRTGDNGREITLYRIQDGQSCLLGSACGASLPAFPASVVAEQDTVAAFLPQELVQELFDASPAFRGFVLNQFALRLAETMELVEEIAFRRVDERLRDWLLAHCRSAGQDSCGPSGLPVRITHQAMADHLGTSREVVSRILKDWEARSLVQLGRNSVSLLPGFEHFGADD